MKPTQTHQKGNIRAVYPNGREKRGYHVVLTMQNPKLVSIPNWLAKWMGNLTLQPLG